MDENADYGAYDEVPNLRGEDDALRTENEQQDIEFSDDESEDAGTLYDTAPDLTGFDEAEQATPIMPEGDDLIYHQMKARLVPGAPDLALEEFSRPAAGFGMGGQTHYMSAEEREAYRLSVNEQGQLVDAEGNLYTSGENAQGHLPGSTGGDLFVMDQGGVFAADVNEVQNELNQGTSIGPGQGRVVHHSTLAAGQREEDEDGNVDRSQRLRVAAAGELRVELRDEQRWEQDEHGRLVRDEYGNYVQADPVEVQDVRSISDASGHFLPEEDQTLQFVETLQDAGVNLDNTKINLVGKPVFDGEGDLRGMGQPIDVYSGEFIASEGDQLALNQKRSVMDQIAGRAGGPQTEGDSEIMDKLARKRQTLDTMAEGRARRFKKDDGSSSSDDDDDGWDDLSSDDDDDDHDPTAPWYNTQNAGPSYTIDPQTGERVPSVPNVAAPSGSLRDGLEREGYDLFSGQDDAAASSDRSAANALRDDGRGYDEAPDLRSPDDAPFGNPNAYAATRDQDTLYDEASLPGPSEDAPFGNPNAYSPASGMEDTLEDAPFGNPNAYSSTSGMEDTLYDAGPEGDSSTEESAEDAAPSGTPWQDASPQGARRAGPTVGQQRGQAWQDAAPQGDERSGPTIGSRRGGQ